jgi:hypothetical protein
MYERFDKLHNPEQILLLLVDEIRATGILLPPVVLLGVLTMKITILVNLAHDLKLFP